MLNTLLLIKLTNDATNRKYSITCYIITFPLTTGSGDDLRRNNSDDAVSENPDAPTKVIIWFLIIHFFYC